MTNLIGEYECKVDAKGRLLIPSALRKQFAPEAEGRLYVKRGIEQCLEIYQKHDWEALSKKVSSLKLDKTPHFQGSLIGIKGQYLLFEDGTVFNIRTFEGYVVKISIFN